MRSLTISSPIREISSNRRLDREALQSLVPLPETVLQLLGMLDDPDASLRSIAAVAARDVALAARILRLANSAQYGLSRAVGDVATGLQVIGTVQTRYLILASGVMDMAHGGLLLYGLSDRAFRQHCEQVATLSMFVARALQYGDLGLVYSAGLLHDMGKVAINALAKARNDMNARMIADVTATCGGQLVHVEYAFLGIDHTRMGADLAEVWRLPDELCRALAGHHAPLPAGAERSPLACVSIANALACALDPVYPPPNRLDALPTSPVVDVSALLESARSFVAAAAAPAKSSTR